MKKPSIPNSLLAKVLFISVLLTTSIGCKEKGEAPEEKAQPEVNQVAQEVVEESLWHVKDVHPEGRFLDVKALDAEGNIPSKKLIGTLHESLVSGGQRTQIAGDFIFTLATLILEKAELESVGKIAFSGGVFQNAWLAGLLHHLNPGFELFFHEEFSPNDENIPFGQLMYHLNCS